MWRSIEMDLLVVLSDFEGVWAVCGEELAGGSLCLEKVMDYNVIRFRYCARRDWL